MSNVTAQRYGLHVLGVGHLRTLPTLQASDQMTYPRLRFCAQPREQHFRSLRCDEPGPEKEIPFPALERFRYIYRQVRILSHSLDLFYS